MELNDLPAIFKKYQEDPRVIEVRKLNQDIETDCCQREESEHRRRIQEQGASAYRPSLRPSEELENKRDDLWQEIVNELREKYPLVFRRVHVEVSLAFLDQFGIYYWSDIETLKSELQTKLKELIQQHSAQPYNLLFLTGSWRYELNNPRPDDTVDFLRDLRQNIFIWPDSLEGKAESDNQFPITLPKRAQKLFEDFGFPDWAIHQLYLSISRTMPLRF